MGLTYREKAPHRGDLGLLLQSAEYATQNSNVVVLRSPFKAPGSASAPDGQTLLMTAMDRARVVGVPCTLHRRPGAGPEHDAIRPFCWQPSWLRCATL